MKKYIKLYALLAMALFVGACEDELGNSFQPIQIVPGEEIQFGAVAGFETSTKDTRTIYGDINSAKDKIEVNWVPGVDRIQIISPHTTGAEVAEYKVTSTYADQNNNGVDNKFEQYSKAKTLQRIGDAGLQWSNGESYEFYAMYPSHNQLQEVVTEVADIKKYGLKKAVVEGAPEGTMTGYLPVTQDPDPNNPATDMNGIIKIHPDMRYAYMVAKEYYEVPESGAIENEADKIQLNFESLVTALEFELVVNDIGTQNDGSKNITIMALSLTSTKYDLCGKFCYTFPKGQNEAINEGEFEIDNESTSNYKSINMRLGDGITVAKDDKIMATFFVLPSAGVDDESMFEGNDLKLTVRYKVSGQPQIKTATIKTPVQPRKYTCFKNVLLPKVADNVNSSIWWSVLPKNALFSQVSIPVASNVFASEKYGFPEESRQQVKDYTELWDMGVRGFEFVNRRTVSKNNNKYSVSNDNSLYNANFVVDEKPLEGKTGTNLESGVPTFGSAFNTLVSKLAANPKETLVLICTYQAVGDGYDPNGYVKQLCNFLDDFTDSNDYNFTEENFVKITASSTVEELQGKIAIIIRPGDDDRYEDNRYTNGISLKSTAGEDWGDKIMLIHDWGTAFDVWDRRYHGVAREAQFETQYRANSDKGLQQRTLLEDYLWGVAASNSSYSEYANSKGETNSKNNNFDNFGNGDFPKLLDEFAYTHTRSDGGIAYVQEWTRVVPESMVNKIYLTNAGGLTGVAGASPCLWVQWKESYSEKLAAIDGLFLKSVDTVGKTDAEGLFINSLSGYNITTDVKQSLYPFKNSYTAYYYYNASIFGSGWDNTNITLSNMAKGGDHVTLAYDLNKYVYGILSGTSNLSNGGTKLKDGPWGLVMIEHIGNTSKGLDDKSVALVDLIMMNNFSIPLAEVNAKDPQTVKVTLNGEKVNPEAEVFVTWN